MNNNLPFVIGIDPGSYFSGIAVVQGEKLINSRQVESLKNSKWSDLDLAQYMCSFMLDVDEYIEEYEPKLIVVELTSVSTNMHTNKLLSYFEAAALISAGMYYVDIKRVRTTEARKSIFGKGNAKKEDVVRKIRYKYGENLSEDEAEAIVFALFGSKILDAEETP